MSHHSIMGYFCKYSVVFYHILWNSRAGIWGYTKTVSGIPVCKGSDVATF